MKKGLIIIGFLLLLNFVSLKDVKFQKHDVGWVLDKTLICFQTHKENFDFTIGFTTGTIQGGIHCLEAFFPYLISMASGIKNGVNAFIDSPSHFTQKVIKYSQVITQYIKDHTLYEILALIVPEIKDLIEDWNHHSSYQKGKILGYIAGHYGLDFFGFYGLIKGAQVCKTVKKAHKIYAIQKLTTVSSQVRALSYSSYLWQKRVGCLSSKTTPASFAFTQRKLSSKFIKKSAPISVVQSNEIIMDRSLWMGDFIAYLEEFTQAN